MITYPDNILEVTYMTIQYKEQLWVVSDCYSMWNPAFQVKCGLQNAECSVLKLTSSLEEPQISNLYRHSSMFTHSALSSFVGKY